MKARILGPVVMLVFAVGCATNVPPGHVGIVVNQYGSERGVSDYTPTTGTVWYNPFTTSVFSYPTFIQNVVWTRNPNEGKPINEEITFTNRSNMAISVDVSLAYQLESTKIPKFYVQFRSDDLHAFTDGFMHNVARDCFNELGGKYELDQIMGDNGPFITAVRDELQKRVGPYGVLLQQFGIIGAPRPPDAVLAAINAKIQATQLAVQKQNEIVQAEADAKKAVAQAEGEAKAILVRADAQARANERMNASMSANLVQWKALDRWDGKLPVYNATATLPLIAQSK